MEVCRKLSREKIILKYVSSEIRRNLVSPFNGTVVRKRIKVGVESLYKVWIDMWIDSKM